MFKNGKNCPFALLSFTFHQKKSTFWRWPFFSDLWHGIAQVKFNSYGYTWKTCFLFKPKKHIILYKEMYRCFCLFRNKFLNTIMVFALCIFVFLGKANTHMVRNHQDGYPYINLAILYIFINNKKVQNWREEKGPGTLLFSFSLLLSSPFFCWKYTESSIFWKIWLVNEFRTAMGWGLLGISKKKLYLKRDKKW